MMTATNPPAYLPETLKTLISEETLQRRVQEIAQELHQAYTTSEDLVMLCILKGGFMFMADLVRYLTLPCQIEFVTLSSYGDQRRSSGQVEAVDLSLPDLSGKDIVLVEDIVDSGLTLHFLHTHLTTHYRPKSLRVAVLLDKKDARVQPVQVDYVGFEIQNHFVVGYGLDDAGKYRNLPYIAYYPQGASE